MIPGFEQSVTLDEILALFEQNNLQFVKWLGVSPRLSRYTSSRLMLECFGKLSPHDRLIAIDLLLKPEYYFVAGRREPNGKVSP